MTLAYLDTSAAMRLLVEEPESAAWLLHTELRCAARRHPDAIAVDALTELLDSVTLVDLTRGDLLTAGSLPWGLRSNEAIHLAVALRIGSDTVIGYDAELQRAAAAAGLAAVSPR